MIFTLMFFPSLRTTSNVLYLKHHFWQRVIFIFLSSESHLKIFSKQIHEIAYAFCNIYIYIYIYYGKNSLNDFTLFKCMSWSVYGSQNIPISGNRNFKRIR